MCCNNFSRCGCCSENFSGVGVNARTFRTAFNPTFTMIPIDENALLAAEEVERWNRCNLCNRCNRCNFSTALFDNFRNGRNCDCECHRCCR